MNGKSVTQVHKHENSQGGRNFSSTKYFSDLKFVCNYFAVQFKVLVFTFTKPHETDFFMSAMCFLVDQLDSRLMLFTKVGLLHPPPTMQTLCCCCSHLCMKMIYRALPC